MKMVWIVRDGITSKLKKSVTKVFLFSYKDYGLESLVIFADGSPAFQNNFTQVGID